MKPIYKPKVAAEALFRELGLGYCIKDSLRREMEAIANA